MLLFSFFFFENASNQIEKDPSTLPTFLNGNKSWKLSCSVMVAYATRHIKCTHNVLLPHCSPSLSLLIFHCFDCLQRSAWPRQDRKWCAAAQRTPSTRRQERHLRKMTAFKVFPSQQFSFKEISSYYLCFKIYMRNEPKRVILPFKVHYLQSI